METVSTEISTLSLHDALPISGRHLPVLRADRQRDGQGAAQLLRRRADTVDAGQRRRLGRHAPPGGVADDRDRKSTRLNSSHSSISYAVFCLKKKNTQDACHTK